MSTGLLLVLLALFGLAIGSFLNVVIVRVPSGESLVRPPSKCPLCEHEIAARDNIPVLSWILLKGRCRNCGEPIPAARRRALPGARTCVACQSERDQRPGFSGINRRGSKDSQLR